MDAAPRHWPQTARRHLRLTFVAGLVIGVVLGVLGVIVLISVVTVMISLP